MLHGFDISAYNSNTTPSADFVIVKATEGATYTSGRFAAQWASAKTRAKHRGAYHFARPEASSAASQADRFLSLVRPVPGESVWLDLEASDLNQSQTNAWAKAWGDYVREHAPGVTSGIYMGSGYATNGTGRDLDQHFDLWWYPQYPSSASTSTWRTTFDPWLPAGLTCGWTKPHIWQWTANFNGLDANISPLTLDRLAGGGRIPQEEDDMIAGKVELTGQTVIPFPTGKYGAIGFSCDNGFVQAPAALLRVAVHHTDGSWQVESHVTVGRPNATDKAKKTVVHFDNAKHTDYVVVTREDETNTLAIGFDAS